MSRTITIPDRVRSTKNSRQIIRRGGRTRSVMSEAAVEWIHEARIEVRRQWRGRPVQQPVRIHVHAIFSNRRSLPDGDNVMLGVFDAIKGIVTHDDNLACIPEHSFSHEVTPGAQEGVLVMVTPWTEREIREVTP